jgi:cob(I)alamin adenosyltransferase
MSIATKTGDDGTTALLFGRRVPKTDPRIAANGACDELNAALGMVRAFCAEPLITDAILSIQRELVTLMGRSRSMRRTGDVIWKRALDW